MNRYNTYISYLVVQYVHDYVCLPSSSCQLLVVSIPCPAWADDPSSVHTTETYLRHFMSFICMLFSFCFSKTDKLLSVIVLLVHFKADNP